MDHQAKRKFSLKARLRSFSYAFAGIFMVLKTQHNFWIHLVAAAIVIIAGFVFGLSQMEWAIITLTIGFVLSAEIMNSAIEYLVDFTSPQRNPKAGLIKDVAAASVLVSAIAATIVGLLIFIPKILQLL
jgi:diacylglycerol kinase